MIICHCCELLVDFCFLQVGRQSLLSFPGKPMVIAGIKNPICTDLLQIG